MGVLRGQKYSRRFGRTEGGLPRTNLALPPCDTGRLLVCVWLGTRTLGAPVLGL